MKRQAAGRLVVLGVAVTVAVTVARSVAIFEPHAQAGRDAEVSGNVDEKVGGKVDRLFARWRASTPGCAVGVAQGGPAGGQTVLTRAYGMADLERGVRNRPETIFEAGSVSKQFTAAAVLLLARAGRLSLDDPVRDYIPELPDYDAPLTIRQMLTHTSGLRDWGAVAAIGGWPRTTRAYTHAHVLDIVSRQGALNFTPGTRWSYSNTGYNLAAILVSRVSGMSFAEFSRTQIFEPIGMTSTSWRDDHTRVVPGRAIAYADRQGAFHTLMPFEDVHGNGGLLTTVGDLLTWNQHFDEPRIGDAAFVEEQQAPGRFTDGREHDYALGLSLRTHRGVRHVGHDGATAGYRASLLRFPDHRLSVAVLCNVTSGDAPHRALDVAELYLADHLERSTPPRPEHTLTEAEIGAVEGLYRHAASGRLLRLERDHDDIQIRGGPVLIPRSPSSFVTAEGLTVEMDGEGAARVANPQGIEDVYERLAPATPTRAQLASLVGVYASEEAESTLDVVLKGSALAIARRPDVTLALTPVYEDAFTAPELGTVVFRRDSAGRVTALSLVQDRVWDLRFERQD